QVAAVAPVDSTGAAIEAPVDPAVEAYRRFSDSDCEDSKFSWINAVAMAVCSHLSYSEPGQVAQVCSGKGLTDTQFIKSGETQCFVTAGAECVIVAFRGTREILDWFTNLNVLARSTSFGSVHDGFYRALEMVRPQLERLIEPLLTQPRRRLILTGHSLGGALATLAAAHWCSKFDVASVYTYGQPCVGFSSFQEHMKSQCDDRFYRFVNADDIVPRVPPRYRHVGQLIRFNSQGDLQAGAVTESVVETWPGVLGADNQAVDTPTLSLLEFEAIKQQVENIKPAAAAESVMVDGLTQLESAEVSIAQLEGLFPNYFSDHRMGGYLSKILQNSPERT
ncbi:MAG: lipase family protein, partial [Pirellulaceae bacterium]|nr:lipase family protein [Pirellulaceae bacterium]